MQRALEDFARPMEFCDSHCHGSYSQIHVTIWHGAVTDADIELQRERWTKMRSAHGRFGIMTIVLAGAPPPPSSTRKKSVETLNHFANDLVGVANVLEGDGLMTSSARLVITTLIMLLKPPYPAKIFPTMGPAVDWFGSMGLAMSPAQLNSYLQEMRHRLRVRLSKV